MRLAVQGQPPSAAESSFAAPSPFGHLPTEIAPTRKLLHYYLLKALFFGPFLLFAVVPMYLRFHTLRYHVDAEGITMRWGILFRREISLTYTRIQDIHLSSNVIERWLGLAKIQVQTASGTSGAEMTIEGLPNPEGIRDFLYGRMRGSRSTAASSTARLPQGAGPVDELASTLREIADEVRALRLELSGASQGREDVP